MIKAIRRNRKTTKWLDDWLDMQYIRGKKGYGYATHMPRKGSKVRGRRLTCIFFGEDKAWCKYYVLKSITFSAMAR